MSTSHGFPTSAEINQALEENGFDSGFDVDEVDESDIGSDAIASIPGKYHVEIESIYPDLKPMNKKGEAKTPQLKCKLKVLASSPAGSPPETIIRHGIIIGGKGAGMPAEPWMQRATVNFLYGIGLMQKVDGKFIDPKTGVKRIDIASLPERLVGWQFIGDFKRKRDMSGNETNEIELPFGAGAFKVDDPKMSNVTVNQEAKKLFLAMRDKAAKTSATKQEAAKQEAGKVAKQAPAKPTPVDDMDDL